MKDILDEGLLNESKTYSFNIVFPSISLVLILLGFLFKVMHWPGSAVLIFAPSSVLVAYNLSALMELKGKNRVNNLLSVLSSVWLVVLVFFMFDRSYEFVLTRLSICATILVIAFIFHRIVLWVKYRKLKK